VAIAVKLSREFYERFGNDATNELVGVLNTISLSYRDELREINELNFARFDAKVGERLAELRQELKQDVAQLRSELKQDIAQLQAEFRQELVEFGREFAAVLIEVTSLRADIESLRRMLKWMFAFWIPSFLVLVGLLLTRR
jgi:uncharacterized protein involved in exopolysaccharide biosynthesis